MFTLWYSILSWKEYRHLIWEKLSEKKPPNASPSQGEANGAPAVCTLPPKKQQEPSKTIVTEPPKPPPKSPEIHQQQKPQQQPKPLEPPPKPPRSPSPHPIRTDAFEEIEYEEDSDIEEEDDEEEENSVVDSFQMKQKTASPWDSGRKNEPNRNVNDFLKQERKEVGFNQR